MKIKALIILFACLVRSSVFAQIHFEKGINSSISGSIGNYVVQTTDEGYLGLGDFLFRTDKFGDTLWTKKLLDKGNSIASLPNEEYLLSGELDRILTVAKIDKNGNLLWLKKLAWAEIYEYDDQGTKIISTTDNNSLVISGNYIIKLNDVGDTLWSYKDFSQFRSINEINGYYYAITWGVSIYKLSPSGKPIWIKSLQKAFVFGNGGGEIVPLPNNNIMLLSSSNVDDGNLKFTKINEAGDTLWSKITSDYVMNNSNLMQFSVAASGDGIFVFSATSNVIKYDFDGNKLWGKSFPISTRKNDIQITKDGGFVLLGTSTNSKVLLIKVGPELISRYIPSSFLEKSNFYPNPFSEYSTLNLTATYPHLELTLVSNTGIVQKKIYSSPIKNLIIEKGNLPKGVYLYEVKNGNTIVTRGKVSIE